MTPFEDLNFIFNISLYKKYLSALKTALLNQAEITCIGVSKKINWRWMHACDEM
jgi:hypothetical protein